MAKKYKGESSARTEKDKEGYLNGIVMVSI